MYYLKSRYYDPEVCRFINADAFVSTGQGIIGYNMFAYCNNNPVNGVDLFGCWVIGIFGASFNCGAGVGGSTGTIVLIDDEGNSAVIYTGFYGGSTPNIGASVDALLFSGADNIFEYIMAESITYGGSASIVSLEGHIGVDTNGNQFSGLNVSFGLSALPVDLKGGIGYAYLEEIITCQGRSVPKDVTMDFFSDLPWKYQKIIHEQLGIPYAPPRRMAERYGASWRALTK